jgi:hypothetical protein
MIKFVVKPGFYEKRKTGKNQPGLDLWRTTLDTLVDRSLAVTTNCCDYYPTAPVVYVATIATPTEAEMDNANIPIKGLFFAENASSGDWTFNVRASATVIVTLGTND